MNIMQFVKISLERLIIPSKDYPGVRMAAIAEALPDGFGYKAHISHQQISNRGTILFVKFCG